MAVHSGVQGAAFELRPGRDWFAPVVLFASAFLVLLYGGPALLGDPDTHWHIAVGEWIWRERHVPWTDPFSHTFAGQPWIAKEWLSQLILFAAKSVAGWTGVVAVTAFTVSLLLAFVYAWFAERSRPLLALTLTLLACVLLAPHFLARPHVFAFLTLFLWVRGLLEAREQDRRPPVALAAVIVLWANLHGSFTVAYPIAAIFAFEALVQAPAGKRLEVVLGWGAFGALSLAAGCATPYGIHALLVTFTVFGSGESLPFINEWQPIGWTHIGFVAGASAIGIAAALASDPKRNAVRLVLLGLLTLMFVRHSRFLDVFALTAPFLAVRPLTRRFPELAPDAGPAQEAGPLLPGIILACLAAGCVVALSLVRPEPDPSVTPRAALAAAREAGVSGAVYNSYDFGGFLIAEGVPTFIDGRTDQLFLGGFISALNGAVDRADGRAFFALLDARDVTWAIVRTDTKEPALFEAAPGWSRLYRDKNAAVYASMLRGSLP